MLTYNEISDAVEKINKNYVSKNNIPLNTIKDSKGNSRFVEGEGTPLTQEGVTITYNKWSLSGSHLMLVLCGTIADTTLIAFNTTMTTFNMPNYILDKLVSIVGTTLEYKTILFYASDYSTQQLTFAIRKITNGVQIATNQAITLTKERTFRVQFDLLIDTE